MDSIIQTKKECFFCGNPIVHRHHVFFGPNRSISEKMGCVAWLCPTHHNMSNESVHMNRDMDMLLKTRFQRALEQKISREEFIGLFGKSWI